MLAWPALGRLRLPQVAHASPLSAMRRATRTSQTLPPLSPLPVRLSRDAQWDLASAVITQSIARVAAVQDLQRSAEQQLDSATYAIQRLFDELSGVMTILPATPAAEVATGQVVRPFTPAPAHPLAAEAIAA